MYTIVRPTKNGLDANFEEHLSKCLDDPSKVNIIF